MIMIITLTFLSLEIRSFLHYRAASSHLHMTSPDASLLSPPIESSQATPLTENHFDRTSFSAYHHSSLPSWVTSLYSKMKHSSVWKQKLFHPMMDFAARWKVRTNMTWFLGCDMKAHKNRSNLQGNESIVESHWRRLNFFPSMCAIDKFGRKLVTTCIE